MHKLLDRKSSSVWFYRIICLANNSICGLNLQNFVKAKCMDWISHLEKEKKRIKSQLYKEMLDNQLLLNLHYKKEQLVNSKLAKRDNRISRTNRASREKLKDLSRSDLQAGHAPLPSILYPNRYQKAYNRPYRSLNPRTKYSYPYADESSGSEMDEIIRQLQTINQKNNKNNQREKQRLIKRQLRQHIQVNLSPVTAVDTELQDRRKYNELQDREKYKSKTAQKDREETPNPEFLTPQHVQKLKQLKTVISDSNSSSARQNLYRAQLRGEEMQRSRSDQMKREREKFLQVLKKVNNRGRHLLQKVARFPSPKAIND